jgi:hypothetical protein
MVEKLTFNYLPFLWGAFLQSACQMHALSKLETSVPLRCVTKLHILEWPFIIPSTRCTCIIIILFNQLLDMPHLSGGYFILAKGEMFTNRDVNTFAHNIFEK